MLDEGELEVEEEGIGLVEGQELCVDMALDEGEPEAEVDGIGLVDGQGLKEAIELTVPLALPLTDALADALADALDDKVCDAPILTYNNSSSKLRRILCIYSTNGHLLVIIFFRRAGLSQSA